MMNFNFNFRLLLNDFKHLIDDKLLEILAQCRFFCKSIRFLDLSGMNFITPNGVLKFIQTISKAN